LKELPAPYIQIIEKGSFRNMLKNIIFDLGGVLLDLDFEAPLRAFQQFNRDGQIADLRQFLSDPVFIGFETGDVSPSEFRNRVRLILSNPYLSDEEIDTAWCSMLREVPADKVSLLQRLSGKYRLFLYSNTNAIHIPHFSREFYDLHQIQWESLFEKTFYSHEINDRKPLLSGYLKVLSMAGINPEETLFVDDLEQNIVDASQSGMKVLHYIPGTDLQEALESMGIVAK
jgi:glucose-1-phosphatase